MRDAGSMIERAAKRIPRLPRKWRIVRNLGCALLLAAVFVLPQLNLYPPTLMSAYRRACTASLLGEPEIIWQQSVGADGDRAFLVADAGNCYVYGTFHSRGLFLGWAGSVLRWSKSDLTLMPFQITFDSSNDIALQLVLFHDVEGARYAEVDISFVQEINYGYNGQYADACYRKTRTVTMVPDSGGVMFAILTPESPFYSDPAENIEGAALRAAEVAAIERLTWGGNEFPITIRLYGEDGTLLLEEDMIYSFERERSGRLLHEN